MVATGFEVTLGGVWFGRVLNRDEISVWSKIFALVATDGYFLGFYDHIERLLHEGCVCAPLT